ncbi:MAG: hypothetical protein CMI09_00675 [Oceanospirillaceae bacterium]|nr:hypothetical protein [Oceanospirillaceae bacterium]
MQDNEANVQRHDRVPPYGIYTFGVVFVVVAFLIGFYLNQAPDREPKAGAENDRLAQIELTIEHMRVVQMGISQGVESLQLEVNQLKQAVDKIATNAPVASSANRPLTEKLDRDISDYMAMITEEAGSIADAEAEADDGSDERSE